MRVQAGDTRIEVANGASITVPAGVTVKDLAGNNATATIATGKSIVVDSVAPTVTITSDAPFVRAGATATLLDAVQVKAEKVATKLAGKLEQYGNQVQVVTAEDISAGGYTNMAEIARGLVRGANIGYSPDEGEFTIRLDGGGDRDTLVALDGMPLYDRGPGIEASVRDDEVSLVDVAPTVCRLAALPCRGARGSRAPAETSGPRARSGSRSASGRRSGCPAR